MNRIWVKTGTISRGKRLTDLAEELKIHLSKLSLIISGWNPRGCKEIERRVEIVFDEWDREMAVK